MTGLEIVQKITYEIIEKLSLNPTTQSGQMIYSILKSHIAEVSQSVTFDQRAIPEEIEKAKEFRGYAKGAAYTRMGCEGLPPFAVTTTEVNDLNEEVVTYKVFVLKP